MDTSRVLSAIVSTALLSLILAGCTLRSDEPPPSPTSAGEPPASEPAPAPEPAVPPLTIPDLAEGELARATFTAAGTDGIPTGTSETLDVPVPGAVYAIIAECTAAADGVVLSFEVLATDPEQMYIVGGDLECNAQPFQMTGPIDSEWPPQVVISGADGVSEAYVVIVPDVTG